MPPSAEMSDFLADERSALDRLELFSGTPEYYRLLAALPPMADGDVETWLARWLLEGSVSLGGRPFDLA